MSRGMNKPAALAVLPLTHGFVDDFVEKHGRWTTVATDAGTATVGDTVGGVIDLVTSDGTPVDNDETYIHTAELFKIADDKPISFTAYCQYAEAATDDANIYIGLMDAVAADAIVDDGAGPKTSFSGAGFFKVDGGTNWNVIYSDGATQTKVELTALNSLTKTAQAAGGSSFQKFQIDIVPVAASKVDVMFFIDDKLVYKMKDQTYANATETSAAFGVKTGSAASQTFSVDYVAPLQVR